MEAAESKLLSRRTDPDPIEVPLVEVITGFAFGFVGSLHCIGMCGPLVLVLSVGGQSFASDALGRILYNFGRVLTYTMMGGIIALVGSGVLFPLLQQNLSIVAGALILGIFLLRRVTRLSFRSPKILESLMSNLQRTIAGLIRARTSPSLLLLGVLNGLLPCGFVYVAIAAAAVTADVTKGMMFMAGFGLGTIPAMLGFSLFPQLLSQHLRARVAGVLPAFTLLVGILLILRGLNLGVPFISPDLSKPSKPGMMHHH